MKWLIKLLGGYTEEEYLNKISELNKTIDNKNDEIQSCRTEIMKSHQKIDKLKSQLTTDQEEVEEPKKWYRMYVDFNGLLSMVNDEYYIEPSKIQGVASNDFRKVFNYIWKDDSNKRVTTTEFNNEYNKLYNNRDSELIDYDLRSALIRLEKFFKEIEPQDAQLYDYNYKGHLILKQTGQEVH